MKDKKGKSKNSCKIAGILIGGIIALTLGSSVGCGVYRNSNEQLSYKILLTSDFDGAELIGEGTYKLGETITIEAEPIDGYKFAYWNFNGLKITDNPYTFELTEDTVGTYEAVYEEMGPVVTVSVDGTATKIEVEEGSKLSEFLSTNFSDITDYNSCGWFSTDEFIECVDLNQTITENISLYTKMATLDKLIFEEGEECYIVSKANDDISGEIVIPKCYKEEGKVIGLPVTTIGSGAFRYCYNVTGVIIPNSVTSIGEHAFSSCESLTSVIFGGNSQLTSIGRHAFSYCTSLTQVTIPEKVTSIGYSAFSYCTSLTEINYNAIECADLTTTNGVFREAGTSGEGITVNVGVNVTKIPAKLFDSTPITKVIFDNDSQCTSIGEYAFSDCTSLTSVTIPSSVTNIGVSAFEDCVALAEVYNYSNLTVTKGTTSSTDNGYLGQYAKVVYNKSDLTGEKPESRIQVVENIQFYVYGDDFIALAPSVSRNSLTSIILDSRTTEIDKYAFSSCESLTSVIFGGNSQLTSIGRHAFSYCTSLTQVTIPEKVTSIGEFAFYNTPWLLELQETSQGIYACSDGTKYMIKAPTSIAEIDLTDVKVIADYAFAGCDGLTSVTIPEGVTSIGICVFYGCESLISVTIPKGVTNIGSYAFYNCESLTSVTIPEGVTSIGENAFSGCDGLTSITIPSSVTNIGVSAFEDCFVLAEVYNYSDLILAKTSYDYANYSCLVKYAKVIYNKSDLTGEKPASRIQTIGNIQYYVYEDDFIALAPSVYRASLTTIAFDSRTTEIDKYAFQSCTSITSITIPSNVKVIDACAFIGCINLNSVIFEENSKLEIIGMESFALCNLTSITIPSNVKNIIASAFVGCDALAEVYNYSDLTITKGSESNGYLGYYAKVVYNKSDLTGEKPASRIQVIDNMQYYVYENDFIALAPTSRNITTVSLDSRITEINEDAFDYCTSLTEIAIPEKVTSIGESAFSSCKKLTSVTINSSYVYTTATSTSACGYLLENATTINVLASIVDDSNNTNALLKDATKYTKSEKVIINGIDYYTYTKVTD